MSRRTKLVRREVCGIVRRVPPQKGGAVAHCIFCQWGGFIPDNARSRWNAVDRAAAALRGHERKVHPDKLLHITTAKEFLEDK